MRAVEIKAGKWAIVADGGVRVSKDTYYSAEFAACAMRGYKEENGKIYRRVNRISVNRGSNMGGSSGNHYWREVKIRC